MKKTASQRAAAYIKKQSEKHRIIELSDFAKSLNLDYEIGALLRKRCSGDPNLSPELLETLQRTLDYSLYDIFEDGAEALDDTKLLAAMQFETIEEEEQAQNFLREKGANPMELVKEILRNNQPSFEDRCNCKDYCNYDEHPVESLILEIAVSIHDEWQRYGDAQSIFYTHKKIQYYFVPFEVLGWSLAKCAVKIARFYVDALKLDYEPEVVKEMYCDFSRSRLRKTPVQPRQKGVSILAHYISRAASPYAAGVMTDSRYVQYYILPQLAEHGGLTEQQVELILKG